MKVFVTKYALTQGIRSVIVEECGDGMVKTLSGSHNSYVEYFHGKGRDWHETYELALERADILRTKKILQLQKKIHNLSAATFPATGGLK